MHCMAIIAFNCQEQVKRCDILSSTGIAIGGLIAGSCVSAHAASAENNSDPYWQNT